MVIFSFACLCICICTCTCICICIGWTQQNGQFLKESEVVLKGQTVSADSSTEFLQNDFIDTNIFNIFHNVVVVVGSIFTFFHF